MKSKRYFLSAALVLVCLGVSAQEVAAAPRAVSGCGTISAPGSYILSRSITATGTCIIIAADNVTFDLDGQTLRGNGSRDGITDNDVARRNITIRNGVITNFEVGIDLGESSEVTVERMRVIQNGGTGIDVGTSSIVRDNIASGNSGIGIRAPLGNLVTGNVANNNGGAGIYVGCPSNLVGNTATGNSGGDIVTYFEGCTRYDNNPAP